MMAPGDVQPDALVALALFAGAAVLMARAATGFQAREQHRERVRAALARQSRPILRFTKGGKVR